MRLIPLVLAALVAAGCANIGSPPGGPTRTEPPVIVSVTPDSGAVNVRAEEVTFTFDAVVSDRPGGATSLEALFLVSPRDGTPRVAWERSRVEVRPRRGFRPNTAYSVTLLPGITDLRGNVSRATRTIVFSTGPTIPPYSIRGRAFDWIAERPAPNALVEVMRLSDSLVYVGVADSLGQFAIGPLASGSYVARLILDNNRNRALDPAEPWDSVAVTVREVSPFIELLAAPRDTIGPRLLTVEVRDSLSLVLGFDRPLDPAAPLSPESFRVLAADSTRLTITRATARVPESIVPDSARRDSAAAPTSRIAIPRPSVRAPSAIVTLQLDPAAPLRPGSYRVTAVNARGLLGVLRSSDRVITVNPPQRPDTTAAPSPTRPPR